MNEEKEKSFVVCVYVYVHGGGWGSTCSPSPSSIFLASVISGILSVTGTGYPSACMT